LLLVFVGLFMVVALFSVFVLHRGLAVAAIQADSGSFSNVVFIGLPILTPLFGSSSILVVAVSALVVNVTLTPLTVIMAEYDQQLTFGGRTHSIAALVGRALWNSLQKPVVWAPLLGTILVVLGLSVPKELVTMLNLIGSATSGVALFVSGLILAASQVKVTVEIAGNTLVKMIVQPVLMGLLVTAFHIGKPLSNEAILLCTLPSAVVPAMFALHYHAYQSEAASTLLLTTLAMIVVLPMAIALTGS
jgi:malonate transporter